MTHLSSIEGHRLWASVYDFTPNPLLSLERRSMWDRLKALQPAVMIDVACGTGHWSLHFQQQGTAVLGVDACEQMLSEARTKLPLRTHLAIGEAENLPFRSNIANLVLCSMALGYFHDIDRVFQEFTRVSAPGACVAVSDLHPMALAAGWTRSFKLGEERYEIEHYCRPLEEIERSASRAGLCPTFYETVYFSTAESLLFKRAGKEYLFDTLKTVPALFISLWSKPC